MEDVLIDDLRRDGEASALRAENARLRDEAEAHDRLISMQHERTMAASELWQKVHDKPDTIPDLGDLIEWLMTEWARLWEAVGRAATHLFAWNGENTEQAIRSAYRILDAALDATPDDRVLVERKRLLEVEWVEAEPGIERCPWCINTVMQGHAPDCWLARAIGGGG